MSGRFLRRVAAIAGKEVLHVRRDPRTLYMALAMPLLLVLIFGFGVRFELDRLPVVWVDEDGTAASRELRDRIFAPDDLARVDAPDVPSALALLRSNDALAVLVAPTGLAARSLRGDEIELQLLVDGTDATTANQVLAKVEALGRAAAPTRPALRVDVVTRYNPTGSSAQFLVPGTIAYVLALVAVLLTALAVAREWERGSMEQLFATPVGRLEIVCGKLLPYLALGVVDVLVALGVGGVVFDVPFRGSMLLVLGASVLFLVGMLGQGLLISVVTRNQMVATMVATFSAMLPSMLLSGFLFPVGNLPWPLQLASALVPARWFVALMRQVLLQGAGLSVVWPSLVALTLFAVLTIAASTARFERRIA